MFAKLKSGVVQQVIDNTESMQQLKHQIGLLERKLNREKIARQEAEKLLMQLTEESYFTSQALRASLRESQKREQELKYLHNTTERASEGTTLDQLISLSVESATQFSQSQYGVAFYTYTDEAPDFNSIDVWHPEAHWHPQPSLVELIYDALPLEEKKVYDHWSVSAFQLPDTEVESWLLHIMVPIKPGEKLWFALISEQEYIDEEMLFVLDTTRRYLITGIKYRIKNVELTEKKVELSEKDVELDNSQKEKQALEERLQLSDKMALLGQLAAGVAHEINNPMGFVRSNSEILSEINSDIFHAIDELKSLAEKQGDDFKKVIDDWYEGFDIADCQEAVTELLESNETGINRITDIVKSLRSFSHHGKSDKRVIAINEPIDDALKITYNLYKYNVDLLYSPPNPAPQVIANSSQLQQVFINMISNAVHAIGEKGELLISIVEKPRVVEVKIKDSGCGMDQKTLEQLYTPFYTTKPPGEGTGLGLSMSFTIIEDHDATVDVKSEVGKGTEFTLKFKKFIES